MRNKFLIILVSVFLILGVMNVAGQVARPSITPGWGRLVQWILNGQETLSNKTFASPTITGTVTIPGGTSVVPLKIGTKSNSADAGLILVGSTDNTGGVQIFADDGGDAAAQITSPLWTRYMLTVNQSSGATQTGLYAQLKTKDATTTFTSGSITAAKIFNQAGVVTLASGAEYGIINAGTTLLGTMTVPSGTAFSGVDVNIGGAGPVSTSGTGIGAGVLVRSKGEGATWPIGLKISDSAAAIGIDIGTCTTDIILQNEEKILNDVNGVIKLNGAVNFAAGTYAASVGVLGGAGSSGTSNAYDLGATAGNTKGLSFYLKSTSTLASDVIEGLYVNTYHGVNGTSAAPSGEAGRFRAYLIGDQSGTVTLTGMHTTVEFESGASGGGLVVGGRSNLVLANEAANLGTAAGFYSELYSGGSSTSFVGMPPAILKLGIGGTITDANFGSVPVIALDIPAGLVSSSAYIVDTDATNNACAAKMRIRINNIDYWIMLAAANN